MKFGPFRQTFWILVAVAAVLIVWDVFVYVTGYDSTISLLMLFFSEHIVLVFACGVLGGHFFWPQYREGGWKDEKRLKSQLREVEKDLRERDSRIHEIANYTDNLRERYNARGGEILALTVKLEAATKKGPDHG